MYEVLGLSFKKSSSQWLYSFKIEWAVGSDLGAGDPTVREKKTWVFDTCEIFTQVGGEEK